MKVLAIEFSSAQRSLAVAVPGANRSTPAVLAEAVETGGRAANTFAMAERVLQQAGVEREEVECIAVGTGPGSYTGIRASIAAAQGWQLAQGVKLVGISSADCIAFDALEEGVRGRTAVVIDAQRGEFYVSVYDLSEACTPVSPLKIVSPRELAKIRSEAESMVGPDVPGDISNFRVIYPRAATLARLSLSRTDFLPGNAIEPIYLRETTFVKAPPPRTDA